MFRNSGAGHRLAELADKHLPSKYSDKLNHVIINRDFSSDGDTTANSQGFVEAVKYWHSRQTQCYEFAHILQQMVLTHTDNVAVFIQQQVKSGAIKTAGSEGSSAP